MCSAVASTIIMCTCVSCHFMLKCNSGGNNSYRLCSCITVKHNYVVQCNAKQKHIECKKV